VPLRDSSEGAFVGEKEQAGAEGAEARQNIKMASTMATDPAEAERYIKMAGVEGERSGGPMKMATAEQYIKMGSVEGERWKGATGDLAAERSGPVRLDPTPARASTGEDDWTDTGKKSGGGGGGEGGEQAAGDPGSSNP
jgi:hypothetical protein